MMGFKINHKAIQTVLQSIGIIIFVISVAYKLKNLVMYGGTTVVKEDEDGDEIDGTVEAVVDKPIVEADEACDSSDF